MEKLNQKSLIYDQIEGLAKRYRKNWRPEDLDLMAAETSKSLKYVPTDRIEELFSAAFEAYETFPTDKQIIAVWKKIKNRQELSGYYDPEGFWVPAGTYLTVLTCSTTDWLLLASDRAMELVLRKKHGVLQSNEESEYAELMKKRVRYPRGGVQKPKYEWEFYDHRIYEDYLEKLEERRKTRDAIENQIIQTKNQE